MLGTGCRSNGIAANCSTDGHFCVPASWYHPFGLRFHVHPIASVLCLQGVYHEKVVPAVCGLVSGPSQPVRVRGHAAAAIVNFADTEDVPEEAVTPHLDALLSALCSCLNGGVPQSVQVRVYTCPRSRTVFVSALYLSSTSVRKRDLSKIGLCRI